ncbi:hypothetical protein [Novipirellula sp.]|uniref:hypothetical protein n=1 Tax=Novipirellula sp. TaxID=2795430 RepID=UPI003565321F
MPKPNAKGQKPEPDKPERAQVVNNLAHLIIQAHRRDQSTRDKADRPSREPNS